MIIPVPPSTSDNTHTDSDMQTFDELMLLKRGGTMIYNGPLGEQSSAMVNYFEAILGVAPIGKNYSASIHRQPAIFSVTCCVVLLASIEILPRDSSYLSDGTHLLFG